MKDFTRYGRGFPKLQSARSFPAVGNGSALLPTCWPARDEKANDIKGKTRAQVRLTVRAPGVHREGHSRTHHLSNPK